MAMTTPQALDDHAQGRKRQRYTISYSAHSVPKAPPDPELELESRAVSDLHRTVRLAKNPYFRLLKEADLKALRLDQAKDRAKLFKHAASQIENLADRVEVLERQTSQDAEIIQGLKNDIGFARPLLDEIEMRRGTKADKARLGAAKAWLDNECETDESSDEGIERVLIEDLEEAGASVLTWSVTPRQAPM